MAGGSLTLAGARLELTGANTYTGGTTIIVGALIANNTTGSTTGPGPVTVPDGTLAGQGTISGPVTLGTASGVGPFLSPGRKVVRAIGNLTALGGLTFAANSTYYCEVRHRAARPAHHRRRHHQPRRAIRTHPSPAGAPARRDRPRSHQQHLRPADCRHLRQPRGRRDPAREEGKIPSQLHRRRRQ
jgi:autotransporter-associated beta strand protein